MATVPPWPNLPKLRDTRIGAIPVSGEWHYDANPTELRRLAESLDVGEARLGLAIDKLPDVWARPIMVSMVLAAGPQDPSQPRRHPLYNQVRGAWRGFLALLGVWHRRGWPLEVHAVDISGSDSSPFLQMLFRLRHRESAQLTDDTTWTRIYVFTMDRLPIGVASPLTLVCPNDGLHLLPALSRVPWFRQGAFVDPVDSLPSRERSLVAGWIESIESTLASRALRAGLSHTVLTELNSFKDALTSRSVQATLSQLLLADHSLFRCLGRTLPREETPPTGADVELLRSASAGEDEPVVLILDRKLHEQWGKLPAQIPVAGSLTFADLQTRWELLGTDPKKLGDLPLTDAIWYWSHAFFTDKLLLVEAPADAFPGAAKPSGHDLVVGMHGATPVLPIQSVLLRHLTPKDVIARASYIADRTSVTVVLRLPLRGGDCVVRRRYEEARPEEGMLTGTPQQIIERVGAFERVSDIPVVEVWPHFRSDRWRTYFVLWDRALSDRTIHMAPPETLARARVRESSPAGAVEREITECMGPPDYFVCEHVAAPGEELGVVVPQLPRVDEASGDGVWAAGIDFGTTNTHVYLRPPGRDEPEALELLVGSWPITLAEEIKRRGRLDAFLPGLELQPTLPFLSLFRSRPLRQTVPEVEAPVLSGHILYYREDYGDIPLASQQVSAYLKWDPDQAARRKVRTYIRQVVLQAAVEVFRRGGTKISFAYSYPTAFNRQTQTAFRNIWDAAANKEDIGRLTSLEVEGRPTPSPESVAAARFFEARYGAHHRVGSVVLDIGGGTTDIAMWQGGRVVWSASVRLAGMDLFLRPLFALYRERRRLRSEDFRRLFEIGPQAEARFQTTEMLFCRELDAVLKSRGERCCRALTLMADTEPVPALLRHVGGGLAGLLYYTGLVLRYLMGNGLYERTNTNPTIYIGGNGSRLLDWADRGRFDPASSHLLPFFSDLLSDASGLDGTFTIVPSAEPKAEAAYGLVVRSDFAAHPGAIGAEQPIVAGEECMVDGMTIPLLTAAHFARGVKLSRLAVLERFAARFNQHNTGRDRLFAPLILDERKRRLVLESVQERLLAQHDRQEEDIELEPPFVTAVRALLKSQLEA